MKLFTAVLSALLLAGCASAPPMPKEVLVPVAATYPVPQLPERPAIPMALQTKDAPDAEKARGFILYIKALESYADALKALLAGYQPATEK